MLTLLIVFAAILVAGLGFWFYNKRQVSSLAEQIYDKNAVINALRDHVDQSSVEQVSTPIQRAQNLTPTVEEALTKKKNPKPNQGGNGKKSFNQKKQRQDARGEFSSSEKKNRPKPRKSKTQQ